MDRYEPVGQSVGLPVSQKLRKFQLHAFFFNFDSISILIFLPYFFYTHTHLDINKSLYETYVNRIYEIKSNIDEREYIYMRIHIYNLALSCYSALSRLLENQNL